MYMDVLPTPPSPTVTHLIGSPILTHLIWFWLWLRSERQLSCSYLGKFKELSKWTEVNKVKNTRYICVEVKMGQCLLYYTLHTTHYTGVQFHYFFREGYLLAVTHPLNPTPTHMFVHDHQHVSISMKLWAQLHECLQYCQFQAWVNPGHKESVALSRMKYRFSVHLVW